MKKMVCELCGGSNLLKQGDFFVCQDCGAQYTVEAARKLLVEVGESSAPVPAASPATGEPVNRKAENLRKLAQQAKEDGDNASAGRYYEQLWLECPDDRDAYFYSNYYSAHNIKIAEIGSAAGKMTAVLTNTFKMLKNSGLSYQEAFEIGCTYCADVAEFGNMLFSNITDHWNSGSDANKIQNLNNWAIPTIRMFLTAGDCLSATFGTDEAEENALLLYKMALQYSSVTGDITNACQEMHQLVEAKHNAAAARAAERYWAAHPTEKQQILDRQQRIRDEIASIQASIAQDDQKCKAELDALSRDILDLTAEKEKLSMLKFKDRHALQQRIDQLKARQQRIPVESRNAQNQKQAQISQLQQRLEELDRELQAGKPNE